MFAQAVADVVQAQRMGQMGVQHGHDRLYALKERV